MHLRSLLRAAAPVAAAAALLATVAVPAAAAAGGEQPGRVTGCAQLAVGAQGNAIAALQRAIGAEPDGDFGPLTTKALKRWQRAHAIAASGVVDAATWAAFPAAVAAKVCGKPASGAGVTASCAALQAGDTGLAVVVLQRALRITADGAFGPATAAALSARQQAAKLTATGTTTRATWKALHRVGTPVCTGRSTAPADAKAQAKVARQTTAEVAKLLAAPGTTANPLAKTALQFARKQVGKPYQYGAAGPKAYDCSGLQLASYLHAGLTLPRVAADQYAAGGKQLPLGAAKQGDLLFYASDLTKPATIYHVVMYAGHGNVITAPETGRNVSVEPLWTSGLLPVAVRPVGNLVLPVKRGSTGWTVSQLQLALNRHGAELTVDGGYGPMTRQAVKAWQQQHDLRANGVVRVSTWQTL